MTTSTSNIFSFTLGHGDIIFDDPHAKSVNQKNLGEISYSQRPAQVPFLLQDRHKNCGQKKSHTFLVRYKRKHSSWCYRYCHWPTLHVFRFQILAILRPWLLFDIFLIFFRIFTFSDIFGKFSTSSRIWNLVQGSFGSLDVPPS